MMSDLQRLREALERGLGPHHDLDGECAVWVDGVPAMSLFLRPGSVTLGPTSSPRGTLSLDAGLLDEILTGASFDFASRRIANGFGLKEMSSSSSAAWC